MRFELMTPPLPWACSTTELSRHNLILNQIFKVVMPLLLPQLADLLSRGRCYSLPWKCSTTELSRHSHIITRLEIVVKLRMSQKNGDPVRPPSYCWPRSVFVIIPLLYVLT